MKEQLISFKTAKLAYEKGYFINSKYKYNSSGQLLNLSLPSRAMMEELYNAPTQALLQKGLREIYNIIVYVEYEYYDGWNIMYNILSINKSIVSPTQYNSYEEALEEGLYEALQLID